MFGGVQIWLTCFEAPQFTPGNLSDFFIRILPKARKHSGYLNILSGDFEYSISSSARFKLEKNSIQLELKLSSTCTLLLDMNSDMNEVYNLCDAW